MGVPNITKKIFLVILYKTLVILLLSFLIFKISGCEQHDHKSYNNKKNNKDNIFYTKEPV